MSYWGGYQRQYCPNYRPSSAYIANIVPSYQQKVLQPQPTYRPLFTPNNAFQPTIGGQSFNQVQSQGYDQRSDPEEKVMKFTPILMTYTNLLPDLLKNTLVAICPVRTIQPPYPIYYDANADANIMVKWAIQLRIVEPLSIKFNLYWIQSDLVSKNKSQVLKRILYRVMGVLQLMSMLIKWRQSSKSTRMKASILCIEKIGNWESIDIPVLYAHTEI